MATYFEGNAQLQVDILEDLSTEQFEAYKLEVTDIIEDGNHAFFLGQEFECKKPIKKKGNPIWSLKKM